MHIIRDTREQTGYLFTEQRFEGVKVSVKGLEIGDYSIAGAENLVAVERKSLPDLLMCLGTDRDRFERELRRARSLESFCVVVEGDWYKIEHKRYTSRMTPESAMQTILAFSCRYRCQFLFVGNSISGEYATFHFLRHYLRGKARYLEALQKAIGF